jgi:hypothetical protein
MLKKKVNQLLAAAGLVMAAMATSAYAHADHSASQPSLTTASSVAMTTHRNVATADDHKGVAFLKDKLGRKAREANVKSNTRPARSTSIAALQDPVAFEEGSSEARHCLRGDCDCTPGSHGRSNCYTNGRGDCPNHQGILCIW